MDLSDLSPVLTAEGLFVTVHTGATGADVQIVPHEPAQAPDGGVGAVLRDADDDNAAARA